MRQIINGAMTYWMAAALVLVLGVFVPAPAVSQAPQTPDPVQVDGEPTCADCTIEMELVTRIGDRDGPGMVYEHASIWLGIGIQG